ncbi:MAG: ferrochelatase [Polyangiaceae bacterium]
MGPLAVLLSCHGSVEDLADLPAFLQNIGRGRPAKPEVLAEVTRRYRHIGGSPLMRTTAAQAAALEERLGVPVRIAGRLWSPYPAEVVAEMAAGGTEALVSLPLAPQSVHVYHPPVIEAATAHGVRVAEVPSWGLEPALIDAFLETIVEAQRSLAEPAPVVLTAHSLPLRILAGGDPYERDFRAMAARVVARLAEQGLAARIAFQSQGMSGDAWLGPDLATTFATLAAEGARAVLLAPIGFLADHVETLYDLDVEAPALAAQAGIAGFARAPAVNVRPRFLDALEAVARRGLAQLGA